MRRTPRFFSILCCIIMIRMGLGQVSAEAGEIDQESGCEIVGRVLRTHDIGIKPNAPLCEGGIIKVGDRLKVNVSCYERSNNQWLFTGVHSVDQICGEQRSVTRACWFVLGCTRTSTQIVLLSPRVGVFEEPPTELEWSSIKDPKHYEIFISGMGENYKAKTQETRLDLSQILPFQPGQIYLVEILAVGTSSVLEKTKITIQVLSLQERNELKATLKLIESSELSQIDKIKLTDAAYMSIGLIENAIAYLESEAKVSKSLLMARLLADRYAEVGDADKAKENYEFVVHETSKTSEDFKLAQEMLSRIAMFQSTKANYQ